MAAIVHGAHRSSGLFLLFGCLRARKGTKSQIGVQMRKAIFYANRRIFKLSLSAAKPINL